MAEGVFEAGVEVEAGAAGAQGVAEVVGCQPASEQRVGCGDTGPVEPLPRPAGAGIEHKLIDELRHARRIIGPGHVNSAPHLDLDLGTHTRKQFAFRLDRALVWGVDLHGGDAGLGQLGVAFGAARHRNVVQTRFRGDDLRGRFT